MRYDNVFPAVFVSRPNRFVAVVLVEGANTRCHVKNTGRLGELLLPGAQVLIQKAANPNRSTAYDLIAVWKGNNLVNIDSAAPNRVFAEWAQAGGLPGLRHLKAEVAFGSSRLDFYFETEKTRGYVEVKGVTLEQDGTALFPDAPTPRGVRHLQELAQAAQQGYRALGVFVIQMKGPLRFAPNAATHPAFGLALRQAAASGVEIVALDCRVTPKGIWADSILPVDL